MTSAGWAICPRGPRAGGVSGGEEMRSVWTCRSHGACGGGGDTQGDSPVSGRKHRFDLPQKIQVGKVGNAGG